MPDDSVLAASVRPVSPGAASTAYFSAASAPHSLRQGQPGDSAVAESQARRAGSGSGRQSTASSAKQPSAGPVAEQAALGDRRPTHVPPGLRTRTTKRPAQQAVPMSAVRAGVQEASAAKPDVRLAGSGVTERQHSEQRRQEQLQQLEKPSKQMQDAGEMILSGLAAAKTRGAIQLTANATVGEPRAGPGAPRVEAISCRSPEPAPRICAELAMW